MLIRDVLLSKAKKSVPKIHYDTPTFFSYFLLGYLETLNNPNFKGDEFDPLLQKRGESIYNSINTKNLLKFFVCYIFSFGFVIDEVESYFLFVFRNSCDKCYNSCAKEAKSAFKDLYRFASCLTPLSKQR